MIKITLTDATGTRYNETAGDWSGETYSMYGTRLTAEGPTIYKAFKNLMDAHFWGPCIELEFPDMCRSFVENADGNTTIVSYTGDDGGNYDMDGRYLVDLFLYVEKVEPVDINELTAE